MTTQWANLWYPRFTWVLATKISQGFLWSRCKFWIVVHKSIERRRPCQLLKRGPKWPSNCTGFNTKNVSKFKMVCGTNELELKPNFLFEISLWSYTAGEITIAFQHVGHKQEGRERGRGAGLDARLRTEHQNGNCYKIGTSSAIKACLGAFQSILLLLKICFSTYVPKMKCTSTTSDIRPPAAWFRRSISFAPWGFLYCIF